MAGAKKTVWDLSLEIAGKDTGAAAALRKVQQNIQDVQKAGKQLSSDFKNFTANIGKLAVGVAGGVAAATAGVVSMANSFAEAGDKAAKTSAALGIGVEAYQELSYAMGQSGVSAQEFDKALQKFNLTVRQGAAGNDAAKKQLEDIGLSAQKLAGMKPEQAIERLSDYMNTLPSDAERTRVAVTLFGKAAGAKMMAAMKQGSAGLRDLSKEARGLGIVMSEEQASQSEAYGDAMDRLKQSVTGMKNQFIGGAIGPLTEAFDHLKNAIVDQMPSIQELGAKFGQWLGRAVQELPTIIANIKEFAANVRDTANKVKDFFGGWENVAKVVGALVIAPTFISGIKTVVSLFGFLKAAVGLASGVMGLFGTSAGAAGAAAAAGGAAGATGFGAMAAAAWAAMAPMLPIIAVVAGVIAITVLLVKNWDWVKETAIKVWDAVCGAVKAAVEFIKNIFGNIGEFFGGVWGGIKETAGRAWEGIKGIAGKTWDGIKGAASAAGGFLKNNWKSIAIGMVSPMAGGLHALYKNHEGFRNLVNGVWGNIKDTAGNAWEGIKSVAGNAWDGMKNAGAAAVDFFKSRWNDLKEAGGQAFSFIDNFSGGALTRIKDNVLNVVNNIKNFFTGLWGAIKEGPAATIEFLKNTFFGLLENIKQMIESFVNIFKEKMESVKGFFQAGIGFIKNIIAGLPEPFQNVFNFIRTVIDSFIGFWKNVFSAGINAVKNIVGILPNIFSDPIGTVKAIIGEVVTFFKTVFKGGVDTVKNIIGSFAEKFGNVFGSLKEKIISFVDFFKNAFAGIKDFLGGIGNKIGGLFGKGKSLEIPGHAEGGIFTHRHIAEIAENGTEAVVPLNSSPHGFDIWKQAGEIGGYLNRAIGQQAAAGPAPAQGTPPVMQAAVQKVSGGENIINVTFTQNNTFGGGTPDGGVVNQIAASGQQAADDFEARVKMVLDNILRNQRRVSFA